MIAHNLAMHGYVKHGAHVLCPVEDPKGAYSERRAQGVDGCWRHTATSSRRWISSYSQPFQAVMQLALYLKYGLFPSNVDTSDNRVVDNTNAGLAATLSGIFR
jgi:hypothetical protein